MLRGGPGRLGAFAPDAAWRYLDDREQVTNRVGERSRVPVGPALVEERAELRKRAWLLDHGPSCLGEDGARPSELAAHANVTRQAVTKVVADLERLGIVRRDPHPADGRGMIVRYTDRGLAGLDIARQRMLELEADYAARIGAARSAEARTILETLFDDERANS